MLVLISAKSGNAAYSQPSNQILDVKTSNKATALAVARLWATTVATVVASKNPITVEVVEGGSNCHAKNP